MAAHDCSRVAVAPSPVPGAAPQGHIAVTRLVVMPHVADVERSLAFYEMLGFACREVLRDWNGRAFWASASSGQAEIMFSRASGPVVPEHQAVIFYLYSRDVAALRRHLLSQGLHDGGAFCGQAGPNGGRCVCFDIARPAYMPEGELRVADPDGYCLLIGQLGA